MISASNMSSVEIFCVFICSSKTGHIGYDISKSILTTVMKFNWYIDVIKEECSDNTPTHLGCLNVELLLFVVFYT